MSYLNVVERVISSRRPCIKRYEIGGKTKQLEHEHKKSNERYEKESQVNKIVFVDKNLQYANAIAEFIEKPNKQECIVFTNLDETLKHIENNNVDALFINVHTSNINVCLFAKKVLEKNPNIRIVIMGGHDTSYIKKACNQYGIDGKVKIIRKGSYEIFTAL